MNLHLYNFINEFKIMDKIPRETLVQYQQAIETILAESNIAKNKSSNYDSRLAIDQLLGSMFPNIEWDAEGKHFKRQISTNPPSREDVNSLQKMLDEKLVVRQARDSGICPIREELHRQCFDEIIRQVTIDCPERGILLMRVRDELYMTINAYEMLYESSLTFSMRKQLQAEQGAPELNTTILELQQKKTHYEQKVEELKKKKDALQKQIKEKKLAQDKKRAEQIDFLKYQANHLQNFLRSVNEANK